MRITIVHGSNDTYGASRVLVQEIECLASLGHSIHVLVPSSGPLNESVAGLGPKVQISVDPNLLILRRSSMGDIIRKPRIPRAMKDADIVVLWTLALAGYVPLLRLARKNFYVAVHELLEDRRARYIFRLLLRGSFPLTACSEATARWLCGLGVRENRVTVTYPVVNLLPGSSQTDSMEPENDRPFTVAVYGRVNGHKGHLEVARAFQEPELSGPDWRLMLAGAPYPGQEQALDEILAVAQCDDRITYVGELRSVDDLNGNVDLMAVFPTKSEPFGLVPIEAWSCGIRSVGYGDGGAAEVLPMVGGAIVNRTDSPVTTIASSLLSQRKNWSRRSALPAHQDVVPKLSLENRVVRLSCVLAALTQSGDSASSEHTKQGETSREGVSK